MESLEEEQELQAIASSLPDITPVGTGGPCRLCQRKACCYVDELKQLPWAGGQCFTSSLRVPCCAGLSVGLCAQVDATDFSEIATTCMEGRCVLDLCVDAADSFIGIVSVEPNELMSSSARVYEVGRRRVQVSRPPAGCCM